MENIYLLIFIGFLIGTIGTLIGAGGGFILVPLLILTSGLDPNSITAISMAVVACNALSGTVAYMRSKKVDYKAGILFALCTIPGSILGVLTTQVIPRNIFDAIFGVVLLGLSIFLFVKGQKGKAGNTMIKKEKGMVFHELTDRDGKYYSYNYNIRNGMILSVIVGYFSPLLGIGGGIIHVPAMTEWLHFPVHIATATSHFILAVMATVSVVTHYLEGSYNNPQVLKMVIGLAIGVIPGAQLGAYFSKKVNDKIIIRSLAFCLGIVAIRIFISGIAG
ncbi:MAG: sulfite exporter TauE/SafE family protein [Ginsengibacter sp.]